MIDLQHLLRRQAEWQKNRKGLSWSAKIRMVEAMQGTLRQLRNSRDRLSTRRIADSTKPRDLGVG
jgi:hypothetical protein